MLDAHFSTIPTFSLYLQPNLSATMSLCSKCVSGVTHEGTPTGTLETIGGIQCYVATPEGDYPKDKVILFLCDIFGIPLVNSKLLADDFAKNGFKTIIPDYIVEPVPVAEMDAGNYDVVSWLGRHGPEVTRPILDNVVAALRAEGVSSIGATGYCFGRYVFDLAFDNAIEVAVISHPSLLKIPVDLEKYVAASKAPLLINSCEIDIPFPIEAQALADKIFGSFEYGYKREYFEGCEHGFAVRGDLSDPKVKAGKEGSFKASAKWFKQHL
ncbi:alpha/beta-hydrolase [Cylindrobasidium torrendii FP15055 ss-10]|uniref:Alpha/beta-hydrolase n=1 Tax=Cylindrobasidium torrendii FP15055 ss-10 TaxID=1314674 RepID=A0A0D7B8A5_9AGAR|nr:alpha/beta-hydrolase [Cylindrobasidium torrendii FP15055 ss-10]